MGKLFTVEDFKAAFSLFCCVYGIGTLGMPGNYARAGPIFGTIALLLMAATNVYSSVCLGKVMLQAPNHVRSYGDVGEFAMGKFGRIATTCTQMAVCLLVPCAFLVLGSVLLEVLFPEALSPSLWIIMMALCVWPICLAPTMKESSGTAFAGCLGTILADFIALGVMIYYIPSAGRSVPAPNLTFEQIISVFGNLSLAYGAAIVIPTLQSEHSEPSRMPRVIFLTLTITSALFMIMAITGYSLVGCQIPGNLLFAISGTKMDFTANRGSVVLAFLFMQLHITVAFSVILNPAMFIFERQFLGMHKVEVSDREDIDDGVYIGKQTPAGLERGSIQTSMHEIKKRPSSLRPSELMQMSLHPDELESDEPMELKSVIFRTILITALVCLSIALQDHFIVLADFIGASCINITCIILPLVFYLRVFWKNLPIYEKAYGITMVGICSILAVYLSIKLGRELFLPVETEIAFPYCPAKYQHHFYTNTTVFP